MEVFDHDDMTSHDVIGEAIFTVAQLQSAVPTTTTFDVINTAKVSKKNYKDSGKVYLKHFKINSQNHTFFDYIRGGTKMQVMLFFYFTLLVIPTLGVERETKDRVQILAEQPKHTKRTHTGSNRPDH